MADCHSLLALYLRCVAYSARRLSSQRPVIGLPPRYLPKLAQRASTSARSTNDDAVADHSTAISRPSADPPVSWCRAAKSFTQVARSASAFRSNMTSRAKSIDQPSVGLRPMRSSSHTASDVLLKDELLAPVFIALEAEISIFF